MSTNWQHYAILDRLQEERERQGLSISELARRSGIHASTIQMHEQAMQRERERPSLHRIHHASERVAKALADGLGVSLEHIAQVNPEIYEFRKNSLAKKRKKLERQIENAEAQVASWRRQLERKRLELDELKQEAHKED